MSKAFDARVMEEERAWELFVKHYRLAQVAWRRWEKAKKRAEASAERELQRAVDVAGSAK